MKAKSRYDERGRERNLLPADDVHQPNGKERGGLLQSYEYV
jgi:hypothetical protein